MEPRGAEEERGRDADVARGEAVVAAAALAHRRLNDGHKAVVARARHTAAQRALQTHGDDLRAAGRDAVRQHLRRRVASGAEQEAAGEFDASPDESEEWARRQTDPQVIAMMAAMGIGPDRSKDQ